MNIQEGLTFDDLLLVPKHSDIKSRSDIYIGNDLGFINLSLPIISSPMDTITGPAMVKTMAHNGGLGILHRYCSIEKQIQMVKDIDFSCVVGAAIGATGDNIERFEALIGSGVSVICIDVAHGDHTNVKRTLEIINSHKDRSKCHIMAGNVASGRAFCSLTKWGADSIRVGIGGGSICSTRINTGFGVPNMSAIFDCISEFKNHRHRNNSPDIKMPSLIIDGGIRNAGDIVKALAAGADFVMCGSLFSGTHETPGDIVVDGSLLAKVYRGQASREAQTDFKGSSSAPEGISTTVPYRGSILPILQDLKGNIQSGFSYAGARNLLELRQKAQFIKQTAASQRESFTHILGK